MYIPRNLLGCLLCLGVVVVALGDLDTSHIRAKEGAVQSLADAPPLEPDAAAVTAGVRAPFDFCAQPQANCQPPMLFERNARNMTNFATFEDFTVSTQTTLTNLCFWGLYFNNSGLGATDDFLVVVYENSLGLPGNAIPGCAFDQALGQITIADKGDTGRDWFGRNEFGFSLNLTGSNCVIPADTCVWIQIADGLTNGDSLFWIETEPGIGDGRFVSDLDQDQIIGYGDIVFGADLSLCVNGPLGDVATTCALPDCNPICPSGARAESTDFGGASEVCGGNANDGCNSDLDGDPNTVDPDPNAFGMLNVGETVCGTTWGDGGARDTDWYLLEITTVSVFEFTVESAVPGNMILIQDSNPADGFAVAECGALTVISAQSVGICGGPATLNANLDAGTYVCFIGGPTDFTGFPCGAVGGNGYVASTSVFTPIFLTCPPGGTVEPEVCGDDLNGGCNNSPGFETFDSLALGEVVCGQLYADQNVRDTDWYVITLTAGAYTARLRSELPTALIIQAADCNATTIVASLDADINADRTADFNITTGGDYYVIALTAYIDTTGNVIGVFSGFPCDTGFNDYQVSINVGCPCVADLTGDCVVGLGDLGIMFSNWSPAPNSVPSGTPGDYNNDLAINLADLGVLFGDWGCQR